MIVIYSSISSDCESRRVGLIAPHAPHYSYLINEIMLDRYDIAPRRTHSNEVRQLLAHWPFRDDHTPHRYPDSKSTNESRRNPDVCPNLALLLGGR